MSGKNFYGSSVEDYWPRRLLHIPSMTSVERDATGLYGNTAKPRYNILTYTWGRWKVKDSTRKNSPALPVKGTPWKIPAIREEHFTVAAFQTVLSSTREDGIDWIWVDVACIDQEDEALNGDEIGRQVSIFYKADTAYVWLSSLSSDTLRRIFDDLNRIGIKLEDLVYRELPELPISYLDSLCTAYEKLFSDPWFSSLWALQEVILRRDAKILGSSGEPVIWVDHYSAIVGMVMNASQNIYNDLNRVGRFIDSVKQNYGQLTRDQSRAKDQVIRLTNLIIRSGFYHFLGNNPNIQYGISKYRQTSRDEDRIYAIMQIYGLRIGKSALPGYNPPLPSLINEFSRAIITQCPIIGQAFIHTVPPEPGLSWRITENSAVPKWLLICLNPKKLCTVTLDSGNGIKIRGQAGLLRALATPWFEVNRKNIKLAADVYPTETAHPVIRESFYEITHEFDDAAHLHRAYNGAVGVIVIGEIGKGDIFGLLITPVLAEKRPDTVLEDGKDYRRVGVCRINSQIMPRGGWGELTISLR